ncbi:MAG: hypothetical protein HYV94_21150 [Candidatus Rokubacteria bacterium]|nr:hypothetical protein [Candidatus Rokubacteria bacterium]
MKKLLMALVAVGLMAGPAFAFRCPLLAKEVKDETSFRFDEESSRLEPLAQAADALASEAMMLHVAGKHVEAMAKMEQAFKLVGLAFQRP